ncbi:PTBP3 protein, partial [Bucco capensis]|nr:PTBP3 protein [Bucco capensis]
GPEELLPSGVTNRPFTMSDSASPTDSGNGTKKLNEERPPPRPSRVLRLRQVPEDVAEGEVISLALPFGKVTNLLMPKGKNQAFLEMASEEAATAVMDHYSSTVPKLRGQPICIQYSCHKELKTDNMPNQARAKSTLQAVTAIQPGSLATAAAPAAEGGIRPSPVVRIVVGNALYPLTLEMLYQIFSKFGSVLKIITFTKNNQFQALLQYADPMSSCCAKTTVDGRTIYSAYCTLRVDFSKLTNLKVKYNNDRSRDFTNPDLPYGDGLAALEPPGAALFGTPNILFPPWAGCAGFAPPVPLVQGAGLPLPPVPGAFASLALNASTASKQRAVPDAATIPGNSVLLVSNLNAEAITPDGLFILFGLYGDVLRVKILYNKKDNALIQMADAIQAQLAISNLNGQKLYGKVLRAVLSKHQTVQFRHEREDEQGLTKDYTNSPLHRFRTPGPLNFQKIYPPCATLHLSNLPPSVTLDFLKNLFARTGYTVKGCRFLGNHSKVAFIELGSVEEAIQALIELHNHDLGENHHLRVSFSKCSI